MSDRFKIVERLLSLATFALVLFLAIYLPLNLEKTVENGENVEVEDSIGRVSETAGHYKHAAVATDRYCNDHESLQTLFLARFAPGLVRKS